MWPEMLCRQWMMLPGDVDDHNDAVVTQRLSWPLGQIHQQENVIFIYHAIAIFVPATNILLKCHIYQLVYV